MVRKRLLRSTVVIPLVLLLATLGGPAYASTLTATSARAFGISLELLGAEVIAPTPVQTSGPGVGGSADNLVEVPLESVAFAGVAGAKAQTRAESTIDPELALERLTVTQGGPAKPALYNAQAYARTAGAAALPSAPVLGVDPLDAVRTLIDPAVSDILAVDGVAAEALVACVNEEVVIAGGSLLTGVVLLGQDITETLDGTVNQVVDTADGLLALVGGRLVANEQVRTPNGLSVNALHLTIPNVIDLVLSHAEVSGAVCDLSDCRDAIDNDGDGLIDFNPPPGAVMDPGCTDPFDDSEVNILPRTGGNGPGLGIAILAAGGLLMLATVRKRRDTS